MVLIKMVGYGVGGCVVMDFWIVVVRNGGEDI